MAEVIVTKDGIVLVNQGGREPAKAPFRFNPETNELSFWIKNERQRGDTPVAKISLSDLVRERLS